MKSTEPTVSAGLRQHCSATTIGVRSDRENRTTARGYGTARMIAQSHPVSLPAVMPSRLAIVAGQPRELRQKPTSKRRGKGVGGESSDRHASGSGPSRARRRASVFAPEGWVQ